MSRRLQRLVAALRSSLRGKGQQPQGGRQQSAASRSPAPAGWTGPPHWIDWVRTPATEGEEEVEVEEVVVEEEVEDGEETKEEEAHEGRRTGCAGTAAVRGGDKEDVELGFPSGAVAAAAMEAASLSTISGGGVYRPFSAKGSVGQLPAAPAAAPVVAAAAAASPVEGDSKARSRSNSGGTSALAVEPLTLTFEDVCYSVTRKRPAAAAGNSSNKGGGWKGRCRRGVGRETTETVDLLQGITGYVAPGTMVALMGASGAGKTTLLDVRLAFDVCLSVCEVVGGWW